ncbi:hypothetical protein GCM10028794_23090 [Silanimonas algicola]
MARKALPHRMIRPVALATAILAALPVAVAPVAAQGSGATAEKKLYRWTDSTGKVHYTDALPPDVVNQARAELSATTGLVRSTIDRALTAEERRAAEAAALSAAEAQARIENSRRAEEAKVSSFRTEEDLRAAYIDRQKVVDETLESLEAAINSQRGSLHQQLGVAGDAELAGRPVAERTTQVIFELREELHKQEQARLERAAERQVLGEEMERLVVLFRERQAARERDMAPEL